MCELPCVGGLISRQPSLVDQLHSCLTLWQPVHDEQHTLIYSLSVFLFFISLPSSYLKRSWHSYIQAQVFSLKRLIRLPGNPSTERAIHTPEQTLFIQTPSSADRLFTHTHANTHSERERDFQGQSLIGTRKKKRTHRDTHRNTLMERHTIIYTQMHRHQVKEAHAHTEHSERHNYTKIHSDTHSQTDTY